jgi:type II secretion system protein N
VEDSTPELPRPLRIAAVALAAIVLFAGFVYLGFPYARLAPILEQRVRQSTGVTLTVGGISPSPHWLGPGIALENLRARFPNGQVQTFVELRIRPAWSLAWLTARPAFAVAGESPGGSLDGELTLGSSPSFEGELLQVDLAGLGLDALAQGVALDGTADLQVSLSLAETGAEGPVSLLARNGTLAHPALPMSIPFEEMRGELVLGGEAALRIESLAIDSSLGQGAIDGSVGRANRSNGAPLDLQVQITAAPAVQAVLRAQGVRLEPDGTTKFRVAGTTARPLVQ